jgi:hypothetical protein
MPKLKGEGLDTTEETRLVFEGNIKAICREFDVKHQFLYALLAGDKCDPFAEFMPYFRRIVRAVGSRARIYLDPLIAIYEEAIEQESKRSGLHTQHCKALEKLNQANEVLLSGKFETLDRKQREQLRDTYREASSAAYMAETLVDESLKADSETVVSVKR